MECTFSCELNQITGGPEIIKYTREDFKELKIDFGDGEEDYMLFKLAAKNWIDKLDYMHDLNVSTQSEAKIIEISTTY